MDKGTCVFCFIYYNCIIILLSVIVSVCYDKGNVFLYNKFTSICILETRKNRPEISLITEIQLCICHVISVKMIDFITWDYTVFIYGSIFINLYMGYLCYTNKSK